MILSAGITLSSRYYEHDLLSDLKLHAMAVYGLAWLEPDGSLNDDFVDREPLLRNSPFDLWVIEPKGDEQAAIVHRRPEHPQFEVESLVELARTVVRTTRNKNLSAHDRQGRPFRLRAIASYDDDDVARFAIIVIGDAGPSERAHRRFVHGLVGCSLLIAVVGVLVGTWLARRSLVPVAETYRQRERFLGGAAHELRNPVASLQAICESAEAGDEPAEAALARIFPIVLRTGRLVENLLLYARPKACRRASSSIPTVLRSSSSMRPLSLRYQNGSFPVVDRR